jgi:hypothetical protein
MDVKKYTLESKEIEEIFGDGILCLENGESVELFNLISQTRKKLLELAEIAKSQFKKWPYSKVVAQEFALNKGFEGDAFFDVDPQGQVFLSVVKSTNSEKPEVPEPEVPETIDVNNIDSALDFVEGKSSLKKNKKKLPPISELRDKASSLGINTEILGKQKILLVELIEKLERNESIDSKYLLSPNLDKEKPKPRIKTSIALSTPVFVEEDLKVEEEDLKVEEEDLKVEEEDLKVEEGFDLWEGFDLCGIIKHAEKNDVDKVVKEIAEKEPSADLSIKDVDKIAEEIVKDDSSIDLDNSNEDLLLQVVENFSSNPSKISPDDVF